MAADLEFRADLNTAGFMAGINRIQGAAGKAGGVLAGAFSVGALVSFGREITNLAGDIKDTSMALGLSTDSLQGLQAAFATGGVDSDKFRLSMGKLIEAQQAVIAGDEKMMEAFSALGLSFRDVADSSIDQLLLKMADGFGKADSHGKAFNATMDILGKGGNRMAAALAGGRKEIEDMAAAATKINPDAVNTLEAAGDRAAEAFRQLKAESANALAFILPGLEKAGKGFALLMGAGLFQRGPMAMIGTPPTPPTLEDKKPAEDPFLRKKRIDDLKLESAELQKHIGLLKQKESAAVAAMKAFNRASPNDRRQMNRDFRDEQRAQSRETRMSRRREGDPTLNQPGRSRDARAGAGRLGRDAKDAKIEATVAQDSIDKITAAIKEMIVS